MADANGLTVAVTGPTGDIGRALLRALDATPEVERVVGMARRPFDPSASGLTKVEYLRGDILDRSAVEGLVKDADVVVHLAFLIFGTSDETHAVNLEGSGNVFEAAFASRARRLVYTSSVAAYGFHDDNPDVITESIEPRGTDAHYYSSQKAALEALLTDAAAARDDTDVYVFRPCIVAGPTALSLVQEIPYIKLADKLPERARRILGSVPLLRPIVPDPGTPFQLVHEDDVAQALTAAVLGKGPPGAYNLAGDGELSVGDVAHALGWYALPVPEIALDAAVEIVSRLPLMPASATWVNAVKVPVLVDSTKARRELGWRPRYDALETLADTITAARDAGLLPWPDRVE